MLIRLKSADVFQVCHSITTKMGWATAIACFSTLQFGYHLAVLNAPLGPISCQEKYHGDYSKTFWGKTGVVQCIPMSTDDIGWITTMFTVGGFASALILGFTPIATKFGRKSISVVNAILYFAGNVSILCSNSIWGISWGRFLAGMAGGSSLVVAPIFINELTPFNHRGLLGSLLQFGVATGILLSQLAGLAWATGDQWRWIFVFGSGIALVQFFTLFTTVESPKWLVLQKDAVDEATEILHGLRSESRTVPHEIGHWRRLSKGSAGSGEMPASYGAIKDLEANEVSPAASETPTDPNEGVRSFLFSRRLWRQRTAVFVIMTGQQLCGMNAITFYGVSILSGAFQNANVLLIAVAFGVTNVVAALVISPWVDKIGRRPLVLTSLAVMGACAGTIGWFFSTHQLVVVGACFVFIIGYSTGLGQLAFLLISELTDHKTVAVAQSCGLALNWAANIMVASLFPVILEKFGAATAFYGFSIICLIYFVLVVFSVPETRHKNYNQVWGTN